jgi:hypothetical protein
LPVFVALPSIERRLAHLIEVIRIFVGIRRDLDPNNPPFRRPGVLASWRLVSLRLNLPVGAGPGPPRVS